MDPLSTVPLQRAISRVKIMLPSIFEGGYFRAKVLTLQPRGFYCLGLIGSIRVRRVL